MPKKNVDRLQAVRASDEVRFRVEPMVCAQCEQVCWSVEGEARGSLGHDDWRTSLIYTDHQPLSTALLSLARVASALGGRARTSEEREFLIEHHPRLW